MYSAIIVVLGSTSLAAFALVVVSTFIIFVPVPVARLAFIV
jgi:hypothetical protein